LFLDLKLLFFIVLNNFLIFFFFDMTMTELLLKHQLDDEEITPETELLRLKLYCTLPWVIFLLLLPLSLSV
jgi:hypothetical protein